MILYSLIHKNQVFKLNMQQCRGRALIKKSARISRAGHNGPSEATLEEKKPRLYFWEDTRKEQLTLLLSEQRRAREYNRAPLEPFTPSR